MSGRTEGGAWGDYSLLRLCRFHTAGEWRNPARWLISPLEGEMSAQDRGGCLVNHFAVPANNRQERAENA